MKSVEAIKDLNNWIRELVLEERTHFRTPGIAVAVCDQDQIIERHVLGVQNMEKDISLGEDDLFQVGSISKTFAAVVALCLCEKGLLDLSQEVRTIIPEFNVSGPKVNRYVFHISCQIHLGFL